MQKKLYITVETYHIAEVDNFVEIEEGQGKKNRRHGKNLRFGKIQTGDKVL